MQTQMNPYNNEAGLVEQFIGTSYDVVKGVHDQLVTIKHVSANLQAVYDFSATLDALTVFNETPDFLTFLQSAQADMVTLAAQMDLWIGDYAALAEDEVVTGKWDMNGGVTLGDDASAPVLKQKRITGTTPVAGYTGSIVHGLDATTILDFSFLVQGADSTIRKALPSEVNAYFDASHFHMATNASEINLAGRTFSLLITYTE